MIVICAYCERERQFNDARQRLYCSDECRQAAARQRKAEKKAQCQWETFLDECFFVHSWKERPRLQRMLFEVWKMHGPEITEKTHNFGAEAADVVRSAAEYRKLMRDLHGK